VITRPRMWDRYLVSITHRREYVCDHCKRPLCPEDGVWVGRATLWWARDDPRNQPPIPARPENPVPQARQHYRATSTRFPVPRKHFAVDMLLHGACADALVKGRLAELADAG
jgi:hypothetical protein